jgi:hypothetical protein
VRFTLQATAAGHLGPEMLICGSAVFSERVPGIPYGKRNCLKRSGPIVRRRDSGQDEDALIGCALHQHKLHLSEVYGLRRDQAGRILLKNDGLVFDEGE